jgi:hypothetical protein
LGVVDVKCGLDIKRREREASSGGGRMNDRDPVEMIVRRGCTYFLELLACSLECKERDIPF